MYIDTHTHLNKEDYDDIEKVVNNANLNDVSILIVSCCNKKDIIEGLELIKKYNNIYITIGYHPEEVNDIIENDLLYLEEVAINNKKVVGIGEIGLDYSYTRENIEKQRNLFEKQIEIAKRINKPIVVHSRDALVDTQEILKKNLNLKGIIHCFTGSIETANEFIKLGYLLGIGGVVTFKNSKLYETIEKIDLSNIVLETDSPYLSPEPFRGKKNESKNIPIIAKKICEIKNLSLEEVAKITTTNAIKLFDLNI